MTFWAILVALIGSVFVLPSLLILWDRWHTKRGEAVVEYHEPAEELEGAPAG